VPNSVFNPQVKYESRSYSLKGTSYLTRRLNTKMGTMYRAPTKGQPRDFVFNPEVKYEEQSCKLQTSVFNLAVKYKAGGRGGTACSTGTPACVP